MNDKPIASLSLRRASPEKRKRSRIIRAAVLGIILVTITVTGLFHIWGETKPIGVDALCPFGGLESLGSIISSGKLLDKIAWSSFIILGATVIVALLFRRSFCGKICPLGAIQEFAGFLRGKLPVKRLQKKRFVMPAAVDRVLRWTKYLVLVGFLFWTFKAGLLAIRPYDPWVAWMHITSSELLAEFAVGLGILVLSFVGSFFYDRFFCKYLCPMGAFLAPISKIGLFAVKREAKTCIDCKACDRACPMNIEVSKADKVTNAECIGCDLCVDACPVEETLVVAGPGKSRLSPAGRLGLVALVFGIVLASTTVAGAFEWRVIGLEERVLPAGAAPTSAGVTKINVDEIKGSDTWESLSKVTGIPFETFEKRFGITQADFMEPMKDKAHAAGSTFDMEAVREFVGQIQGTP